MRAFPAFSFVATYNIYEQMNLHLNVIHDSYGFRVTSSVKGGDVHLPPLDG